MQDTNTTSGYCAYYYTGGAIVWRLVTSSGMHTSGSTPIGGDQLGGLRRLWDTVALYGISAAQCERV